MNRAAPWSKFWWSDWQSDLALRSCSYAARGLWMDMLAIMHASDREGFLLIAGQKVTVKKLAGLTNGAEREVGKLLAELAENLVFSTDDDGVIYSRRMVRDKEKREIAVRYGKQGGNPALKPATAEDKQNGGGSGGDGDNGGVNPTVEPTLNLQEARGLEAKSSKQEPKAAPLGEVASPAPRSAKDILWQDGLAIMVHLTGKSPNGLRGLMGKWLGELHDDCPRLMLLIQQAQEAQPGGPVAWITKAAAGVRLQRERAAAQAPTRKYESMATAIGRARSQAEADFDARFPTIDGTDHTNGRPLLGFDFGDDDGMTPFGATRDVH